MFVLATDGLHSIFFQLEVESLQKNDAFLPHSFAVVSRIIFAGGALSFDFKKTNTQRTRQKRNYFHVGLLIYREAKIEAPSQ